MAHAGGSRERGSQRARRGAVRDALLVVQAERTMHGYELITDEVLSLTPEPPHDAGTREFVRRQLQRSAALLDTGELDDWIEESYALVVAGLPRAQRPVRLRG